MNRVFKYFLAGFSLVLAGCAVGPKLDSFEIMEANEPLVCASKEQCDLYWQKAQIWVTENSHYRIQMANDTIIQTFGPANSSPYLAYIITKHPDALSGGSRIKISGGCANIFGCNPPLINAALSFKRYVKD